MLHGGLERDAFWPSRQQCDQIRSDHSRCVRSYSDAVRIESEAVPGTFSVLGDTGTALVDRESSRDSSAFRTKYKAMEASTARRRQKIYAGGLSGKLGHIESR